MGFKGFGKIGNLEYEQSMFSCKSCDNMCDVTKISTEDGNLFYGDTCEKYSGDEQQKSNKAKHAFQIREDILMSYQLPKKEGRINVGIPRVGMFNELYPLWATFFEYLNFNLIPSDKTNKKIISKGLEKTTNEFCFPFKVAFGHFATLEKADYIFAPDVTESFRSSYSPNGKEIETNWERSTICPYIQNLQHIVAINSTDKKLISPFISFREKEKIIISELTDSFKRIGLEVKHSKVEEAFNFGKSNYREFKQKNKQEGEKLLSLLEDKKKGIVIVGRPYTALDEGMNLRLAKRIADYGEGFTPIPMDFLPPPKEDLSEKWANEFSIQGQLILNSASTINRLGLNAIFLDYFGCGPNSFIKTFFAKELNKSFYTIEIDEHTASAGLVTRMESYLDSIDGGKQ